MSPLLLFSAKDQFEKERHEVVHPSKGARSYSAVPLYLSLVIHELFTHFLENRPAIGGWSIMGEMRSGLGPVIDMFLEDCISS